MKIIRRIFILHFLFTVSLALSQTVLPIQHPRDQIALQLGAIQMGYSVPFQLVGNPSAAQQAANALAMGRNALAATAAIPAVKVQGAANSPGVDSVAFRDQLYQAVEAVVTSPVVGSIKGSVILETGKKQSVSAKLMLPPSSYTIPVPYSLESASSIDAQALTSEVNSLSGSVAAVQKQNSDLITQVGSISGKVTAVQSQTSALSSNVTTLENQTTALSGNLSTLTSSLMELQKQNAALKQLLMGLDIFTSVSTLAGNGKAGYVDGIGTEAQFYYPDALALDASGNVYVNDKNDIGGYRIRKITPEGEVTTLMSFDGELENSYYDSGGIDVDAIGNVYVAETIYTWDEFSDYTIHKVRKITPRGDVSILMEQAYPGSSYADFDGIGMKLGGIAVDASGAVYVTQSIQEGDELGGATRSGGVRKISPSGELSTIVKFVFVAQPSDLGTVLNDGDAVDAEGAVELEVMSLPEDIAFDAKGNMYLLQSDYGHDSLYGLKIIIKVIKIAPAGAVSTLANYMNYKYDGFGSDSGSGSMTADLNGNVYVVNGYNNELLKINTGGIVTTMAGGGAAFEVLWMVPVNMRRLKIHPESPWTQAAMFMSRTAQTTEFAKSRFLNRFSTAV